ncbi:MAG: hypothetical protein IJD58_11210 [Lachnospiraceae bacterium]|jgi:hypothetical protein|nr:hypothetical protein [Lachnospiraceae bacterium]
MSDNFYEAQINNLNFRYNGGNIIEVSKIGDKHRTVLHEIWVKELTTKKEFDTEISFWFMKNASNF